MVTTLYLIRHGEAEGVKERRYKGTIDVQLSEKGVKQMGRVSAFISAEVQKCRSAEATSEPPNLRTSALSAVYCSDLSRAIKSAEIIAEPQSLKPIVVPSLRERNFGLWEGMSFDEIKGKYPEEFDAWANNPLRYSPIGGESTLEVRDRVIAALDRILDENYICIVIVAHGGVNRIILCHILGMPLENIFRIEQDYGALNIIEFWDKYPVVKLINYVV
ncbi:MAG: histidine phosphatase family protein [Nitrospirae bacterium]|nr:histidine phosphatase family protein [Nitrospirota bacterium]